MVMSECKVGDRGTISICISTAECKALLENPFRVFADTAMTCCAQGEQGCLQIILAINTVLPGEPIFAGFEIGPLC